MSMRYLSIAALAVLVSACTAATGSPDASGATDSGSAVDSGTAVDSGPEHDAGPMDSGPVDAGPVDAGPADSGPVDAGPDLCNVVTTQCGSLSQFSSATTLQAVASDPPDAGSGGTMPSGTYLLNGSGGVILYTGVGGVTGVGNYPAQTLQILTGTTSNTFELYTTLSCPNAPADGGYGFDQSGTVAFDGGTITVTTTCPAENVTTYQYATVQGTGGGPGIAVYEPKRNLIVTGGDGGSFSASGIAVVSFYRPGD
jgi:hypothetical protein